MSAELARLVDGFRVSQTLYAAVELGIPDLLADDGRSSDDLAEAGGADASALYRLLRALASLGILHETDRPRFALTELGQPLRGDVPASQLFARAGLRHVSTALAASGHAVMEAVPA